MSNLIGDDAQSARDEEERRGELLCLKIKAQLEDLFSDSHLAEDGFLLKHVQKNKQGFVSLKLLTSTKKIKVLTTDWYMTLAAAEYSRVLEVNDECTKVRRIKPLPRWLLCSPTSKLLLISNISAERSEDGPEHSSLSRRILQKFSAHGSVTSVWILQPGKELPKELQCYTKRHKELGQHLCAVVKFDHLDAVRKAYRVLKAEEETSDGEGMSAVPLGFLSMHHSSKDEPSEENSAGKCQENPTSEDSVQEEPPSSPVQVSDEMPDTTPPQGSPDNSIQSNFEQTSTSHYGKTVTALNQRYSRLSLCSGDGDKENFQSPWVLKRKFAARALNSKIAGHLNRPCLIQRVLRQPRGPDTTKGFLWRRCRDQTEFYHLSLELMEQQYKADQE